MKRRIREKKRTLSAGNHFRERFVERGGAAELGGLQTRVETKEQDDYDRRKADGGGDEAEG